jgi:hypothetical protein
VYPVPKAPTHCRIWGREFLGSLSLAFLFTIKHEALKIDAFFHVKKYIS